METPPNGDMNIEIEHLKVETPLNGDTKIIINEIGHLRNDISELKKDVRSQNKNCQTRIIHCNSHFSTLSDNDTVRRGVMWIVGIMSLAIMGSYGAYAYASVIKDLLIKHISGG